MINIPVKYIFALYWWQQSVMLHLWKDAGKPYLTCFCVIHLFEVDYNFFLKLIYGRRLVWYANKNKALDIQQWGSRQQQTTMNALFLSKLLWDIACQMNQNSALMANDATGCYTKIIVSLCMIACWRLGIPKMQSEPKPMRYNLWNTL